MPSDSGSAPSIASIASKFGAREIFAMRAVFVASSTIGGALCASAVDAGWATTDCEFASAAMATSSKGTERKDRDLSTRSVGFTTLPPALGWQVVVLDDGHTER